MHVGLFSMTCHLLYSMHLYGCQFEISSLRKIRFFLDQIRLTWKVLAFGRACMYDKTNMKSGLITITTNSHALLEAKEKENIC